MASQEVSSADGFAFRAFALRAAIGGMLLFGTFFLCAVWLFGSVEHALAAFNGREVIIDEVTGPVASQSLSIVATNLSGEEISIIGATPSCPCILFDGIPVKVPPRGSCVITAREKPNSSRTSVCKAVIWTSSQVDPRVMIRLPPLKGT